MVTDPHREPDHETPDNETPEDRTGGEIRDLRVLGERIAASVEAYGAEYVEHRTHRVLDAWGRFDPDERNVLDTAIADAAHVGSSRVAEALRVLSAENPHHHRSTPLEIVRTIGREATAVLASAGVAPVVRDEFDERALPDDAYDLAPRTLGDLLAPLAEPPGAEGPADRSGPDGPSGVPPAVAHPDAATTTGAVPKDRAALGALQLAWGLAKAKALRAGRPPE